MVEMSKYRIMFDYSFIEIVDEVLKKIKIGHKSFGKCVSYYIVVNKDFEEKLFEVLLNATYGNVKIEKIDIDDFEQEVGTDKPLGSKLAIDEN